MAEKIQYLGTGRRKTSSARVRLIPGDNGFIINGKEIKDYFGGRETLVMISNQPLVLTNTTSKFKSRFIFISP